MWSKREKLSRVYRDVYNSDGSITHYSSEYEVKKLKYPPVFVIKPKDGGRYGRQQF